MFIEIIVIILVGATINYVYRRKSKYKNFPPGPTGLPIIGYLPFMGSSPHRKYTEIGKKYGDIFSLSFGSLSVVVLNELDLIRTAFRSDDFTGRPKAVLPMQIISDGLTFNEGRPWLEQRKFTLKTLKNLGMGKSSLEDTILEELQKLIQHLKKLDGKPINLKPIFEISIINTLWSIVASEKHSLDDLNAIRLHEICYEACIEPEVAGAVWFLPTLAKMFPEWSGFQKIVNGIQEMRLIFRDFIDERERELVAGTWEARDYIDHYLKEIRETTEPNSSFYGENGRRNLVDTLINLFAAGSDTTTTSLSWSILYLLKYPDVMEKLRAEIDTVVGRDRLPNSSDRPKMPYAEACLHEISRIASIVPGGLLHSTTRDVKIGKYVLPEGTVVMGNLYHVHHDPQNFREPEAFRPERFLRPDGQFQRDEHMLIFSIGKRICPAENLAMTNFFIFLTGLVQSFHFQIDPAHPLPSLDPKPGLVLSTQAYKVVLNNRE